MDKKSNLVKACELSLNDWLATFPEEIPEAEHTENFEKWKKKLFDKMRDNRYHRFTSKTVKVLLIAAILTALLLSAFAIPSSRKNLTDSFDIFSRYELTKDNRNSVSGEITVGYIPEGYEFESSEYIDKYSISKYSSNNDKYFTIFKYSSSYKVEFNTEFYDMEELLVDGIEYTYCKGGSGVDNLIWTRNDYVYRISGPFTVEELLKMAKTVK